MVPGTPPPGRASHQLSKLGHTCVLSVCPGGAWWGVAVSACSPPSSQSSLIWQAQKRVFVLKRSPSPHVHEVAFCGWLLATGAPPIPTQGVLGELLAVPPFLSSRSFAASRRPGPVQLASLWNGVGPTGSPPFPRGLQADSPSCPSSSKGWPCREPAPSPKAAVRAGAASRVGWRLLRQLQMQPELPGSWLMPSLPPPRSLYQEWG